MHTHTNTTNTNTSTTSTTTKKFRTAALAALSVGLAATGAAAGVVTASPASAGGCPTGNWSSTAQNRPASLAAGSSEGYYLWHDGGSWHLRVTHAGNSPVVFAGTIDSSDSMASVERATESKDTVNVSHSKGKVKFTFVNRGKIDGIDFVVGCSNKFTFKANIKGVQAPTSKVFIGSSSINPTSVPFAMERT